MARGGKRPGAGHPRGKKHQNTLEKLSARSIIRERVTAALEPLLQAQIVHSLGIGHLYTRDKHGKFTKIESQTVVDHLLATGIEEKDYWIFTKDPSVHAFSELLSHAFGKPKETLDVIHSANEEQLLAILNAWKDAQRL